MCMRQNVFSKEALSGPTCYSHAGKLPSFRCLKGWPVWPAAWGKRNAMSVLWLTFKRAPRLLSCLHSLSLLDHLLWDKPLSCQSAPWRGLPGKESGLLVTLMEISLETEPPTTPSLQRTVTPASSWTTPSWKPLSQSNPAYRFLTLRKYMKEYISVVSSHYVLGIIC